MTHRATAFVLAGLTGLAAPARADSFLPEDFQVDLKGFLEGRAIAADDTQSWERNGLGKTRYGGLAQGNDGFLFRGEGALIIEPKFGFDVTGHVVVTVASEQYKTLSLMEAYLQYKPAPTGDFGVRARGGFFFPPISLENTSFAWTSPYTITPSAINSWVGEELRTIGGEATAFYQNPDFELGLTGALYTANDPAGTQLTWRGWSLNDREIGLFDRMQLTQIPIIRPPGGILSKQAPTEKPFHEIDMRVGYYAAAYLDHADWGKATVMWYDNNANDRALALGQWAWDTKFWALGYTATLPWDVDLVAQYMNGRTSVVTIPNRPDPLDYTEFWAAYGLVSKEWGRHRLSFRFDRFGASSDNPLDDTNERGTALTLAYNFRPTDKTRITLEGLRVNSTRPERAAIGLPVHAIENQAMLSFRLFFLASVP